MSNTILAHQPPPQIHREPIKLEVEELLKHVDAKSRHKDNAARSAVPIRPALPTKRSWRYLLVIAGVAAAILSFMITLSEKVSEREATVLVAGSAPDHAVYRWIGYHRAVPPAPRITSA